MRGPRFSTRAALCALGLLALAACQRETTPPLIQVLDLSPREVEEGDHIAIAGVGFPEGKLAHVAFRGDLSRPGVAPVRGVEIVVDAMAASATEVDIPFDGPLEKLFAGPGDHAAHTTFSGEVTVAFAARSPAAPPVAATLHDTWLDVRPPTPHRPVAEAQAAEGARTLAFLGIKPQESPLPGGGILIESVEPGSRAEGVRLLAGDVITELDGVRVLTLRDLVTPPGDRSAWLKIRRAGSPSEEIARVSLLGLAPPPAAALLGPVLVLGLAAILLLLFFAPTPGTVAWLERHVSRRIRDRRADGSAPPGSVASLLRRFGSTTAAGLVLGVASGTFALLPFAHYLGVGEIDAGILLLVATTSLATLGLVTGGRRPGKRYSLLEGLRSSARVASLGLPAAAAVAAVVMLTGSLRLEDIVRSQGGWPWGWTLFKSPLAAGLLGIAFVGALVRGEAPASSLPDAGADHAAPSVAAGGPRLFSLAEWAHRVVLAALAAALFFGGWQLPGLAPEQLEGHLGWTVLGAALFVGKSWLLTALLVAARWALPPIRADRAMGLCWRWLVPLSVVAVLLTAVWVAWGPGPSTETLVAAVMLALTGAGALHVVSRVRYFLEAPEPEIDPFL